MDRGTVYTLALQRIGNFEYRDESTTPTACEVQYPHVLRLANARHDWSFCQRRKVLSEPKDYGGGRLLFRLPLDFLKVRRVLCSDGERAIKLPEMVAGGLTTGADGASGVVLDYLADLVVLSGELPDSNPAFCDGVVALLAARIALNLTGNSQLSDNLEKMAELSFRNAIAYDKQQDFSNDRDPIEVMKRNNIFRRC